MNHVKIFKGCPLPDDPLKMVQLQGVPVKKSYWHACRIFHGLADPLCGTSWDKWNWDKLHRGYRACPGQGKASSVGIWLVPWDKERSLFTFTSPSRTGLVQIACLSHWDKHNLSQSACPTGTDCACPSCLSQWDRFSTGTTLPKSVLDLVSGHSLSKTKGVQIEFRKFLIKNCYQIGQNRY